MARFREAQYVTTSHIMVSALTQYAEGLQWRIAQGLPELSAPQEIFDAAVERTEGLSRTIDELLASHEAVVAHGEEEELTGLFDCLTPAECDIASRWVETYQSAMMMWREEEQALPMPENPTQEELDTYLHNTYTYFSDWNSALFQTMQAIPRPYRRNGWWLRA